MTKASTHRSKQTGDRHPAPGFLRIPYSELRYTLEQILLKNDFPADHAKTCADVFALNTLEGVYSHGVNRFVKFVEYAQQGFVRAGKKAVMKHSAGAMEQWDGQSGAGPVNAYIAADRAMELARKHGIGCVALANTNHWLRGGTYAWKAARTGFAYIAWSNTIANMPPWGGVDPKLGNNPIIIGIPSYAIASEGRPSYAIASGDEPAYAKASAGEAIVLDMALSQYSFGALEIKQQNNEQLPLPGGYDKDGNLTRDPAAILESWRPLPIGYWKGAGLSLLLDILATILSGGLSTAAITAQVAECNLSQVFIAVDLSRLHNYSAIGEAIRSILADYCSATPVTKGESIRYPGENIVHTRDENLKNGVPVLKETWEKVLEMV